MVDVLGYRDPTVFKNRCVNVRVRKENGVYRAQVIGELMDFSAMMKLRNTPISMDQVERDLSSEAGFEAANLGLSVNLTMHHQGHDYLVLVKQDRTDDIGDTVAKMVSGYIDASLLLTPRDAADDEISDEVLPVTGDGKVFRFIRDGERLPTPFGEHFTDHSRVLSLTKRARYEPVGLVDRLLLQNAAIADEPGVYFQVPTHSAQLVFSYHIETNDVDFEAERVSMFHTEEVFAGGQLEVRLMPDAMYLVRLEDRDLTDEVYNMSAGRLIQVDPANIALQEIFAPKHEGLIEPASISLMEYLRDSPVARLARVG